MAQANDYDVPPKTPPPAYEEEGRRHSRVAWGGEWPLVDGGVWTSGQADKSADKATQDGKDPKTLGPGVEVVTIPAPRDRLYNTKLNDNEIEVKRAQHCRCALITLLIIKSFVILGLVIGMAVGFHKLKQQIKNNGNDNISSLCAGRTCNFNGQCQELELMSSMHYAWCVCNTGYSGNDCEFSDSSTACGPCVYGKCEPINYPVGGDAQPADQGNSAQYGPNGVPMSTTPCAKGGAQKPSTTPVPAMPGLGSQNGLYVCVCNDGYQDVNCDIASSNGGDPCAGVTCNYQGKCVPSADNDIMPLNSPSSASSPPAAPGGNPPPPPSTSNNAYTCMCKPGYTGQDCEIAYSY